MLEELDRSVTAQRRLVADASHELRPPLIALRTKAELLALADCLPQERRDRAARARVRQLADVIDLVNDLIEPARAEEPPPLLEQVDLTDLSRLTRLLTNLLDNAAKFSPQGTSRTSSTASTARPRPAHCPAPDCAACGLSGPQA
ncbi:histidine kinase dimerization/phospho-acceptor domain-containing protein [Streptomyces sp. 15-116A]|uniref:histidine kinase dimerization/phospho-acceptor domain-containing protein n=1 Tax=Streptomyces sp. 15-116A TaxID=2259035 RepID=UPI0037D9EE2D